MPQPVDEFDNLHQQVTDIHERVTSRPPEQTNISEVLRDLAELAAAVISILRLLKL